MVCTVPNQTAHTLLPIIYRFCREGSVIRSNDWAACNSLYLNMMTSRRITKTNIITEKVFGVIACHQQSTVAGNTS